MTKVGILGYGVDQSSKLCAPGNKDSFEKYPTAKVVYFDDTLGFAEPNLSAQVAQMKHKGVDFVDDLHGHQRVIVLAKEMKKQGLNAVQHLPNGYDPEFIADNADFLEGRSWCRSSRPRERAADPRDQELPRADEEDRQAADRDRGDRLDHRRRVRPG